MRKFLYIFLFVIFALQANNAGSKPDLQNLQSTAKSSFSPEILLDTLLFQNDQDDPKALESAKGLIKYLPEFSEDTSKLASVYYHLGLGYYHGNLIDSSKILLEKSVVLAKKTGSLEVLKPAYFQLAMIASSRRKTKDLEKYNAVLRDCATKTEDEEYVAKSKWLKSISLEYTGEYDSALKYQKAAEALLLQQGDTAFYYRILFSKSTLLTALEQYSSALVMLDSIEKYYLANDDIQMVSDIRLNKATLFNRIGQPEQAINLYFKVLPEYSKKQVPGRYPILLTNLGITYKNVKNYKKAREYFIKALENNEGSAAIESAVRSILGSLEVKNGNLEDAERYLYNAVEIAERENLVRRKTTVYFNLGDFYDAKYDKYFVHTFLDSAISYLRKSVNQYEIIGSTYGKAEAQLRLSSLLIKSGDLEEAEELLFEVEKKAIASQNESQLKGAYDILSQLYRKRENYKLADQYSQLHLEKLAADNETEINEKLLDKDYYYQYLMQIKKDSIENNYMIRMKNAQLAEQERSINAQFWLILGAIVGLLIMLTLVYFLSKRNRQLDKASQLIDRQRKEVIQQRDELSDTLNELKLTQAKLIESAKLSAVGMLSENMAHEINNPLHFIKGSTFALNKLIKNGVGEKEDRVDKIVQDIGESANRIGNIIQGLANTNSSKLALKPHEVNVIIPEVVQQLSNSKPENIYITYNYHDIVTAIVDRTGLEQVLMCLLVNSMESMADGGVIEISVEAIQEKCVISISDHGDGMGEEVLSRAFDPFFSTKKEVKGVGLGLFTAYSITKDMGGELSLKSVEGLGTTAQITLKLGVC